MKQLLKMLFIWFLLYFSALLIIKIPIYWKLSEEPGTCWGGRMVGGKSPGWVSGGPGVRFRASLPFLWFAVPSPEKWNPVCRIPRGHLKSDVLQLLRVELWVLIQIKYLKIYLQTNSRDNYLTKSTGNQTMFLHSAGFLYGWELSGGENNGKN